MSWPAQFPQAAPGADAAEAAALPADLAAARSSALPADPAAAEPLAPEPAEPLAPEPAEPLTPEPADHGARARQPSAEQIDESCGEQWPTVEPQAAEPQAAEPWAEHAPAMQPEIDMPDAEQAPAGQDDTPPATTAELDPAAQDIDRTLDALTALHERIGDLAEAAAELTRLRSRDTELIARLHDDVTRLRNGEIASALNPVVTGMIKLHDQMVSLGALADPASPVGLLHTQLLQILELTCAVRPFTPVRGERFDASRHTGMKRVPTTDPAADGTIAGTMKAGFARADGSVVRVAEVEVHRLSG